MIIDNRYKIFINSMADELAPFLEKLYETAKEQKVPAVGRETQSLLKTLLQLKKPKSILEVGTGTGFSALLMAYYSPKPTKITTIERYKRRLIQARENISGSDYSDIINLIEGDAGDVLSCLNDEYDFIFMDAAKGQYVNFLADIRRVLKNGGILLSDNVLQDGNIIESRYMLKRRDRTIYKRMREYLYTLKRDPEFSTSILPVGDGVALSVKL